MTVEVLRPQDRFAERLGVPQATSSHRRRDFPKENLTLVVNRKDDSNAGHNKKSYPISDKKKSPVVNKSKNATKSRRKNGVTNGGLVSGKVTLLRRGESLDSIASKVKGGNPNPTAVSIKGKPVDDLAVCNTGRIGPESPERVPKQIRLPPPIMYAGYPISSSPSPRAVPLPSFFKKKHQNGDPLEDSASSDLRRLLRLD